MTSKEALERWPCEVLAEWLTATTGDACTFVRSSDAPDVIYEFRGRTLSMEVTMAFADQEHHAKFVFKGMGPWDGEAPDERLAQDILRCVAKKSINQYGENVLLVVRVPPSVTAFEELCTALAELAVPQDTPFAGIYVVGNFPMTSRSEGGIRVLPLLALAGTVSA
ncbi:hypothetical protein [Ottowia oryzae]|uniref:Uncharacterized protein n=1 Tax=Ottowia oryzae TaxID=2109914 RepID=A0A2S0MBY4_9BURK|nr:hypothetical protein [Ottowia oryzae]AVO33404.1 hypothetical protein C6570_03385 [Ottowia oryzae]